MFSFVHLSITVKVVNNISEHIDPYLPVLHFPVPGFGDRKTQDRKIWIDDFWRLQVEIVTGGSGWRAFGSTGQKVSAENLPITPLQQWERGEGQISLSLACAHNYGLNRAAIIPQVIDHETIRVGAGVHPSDFRALVQQTDVLQLQEHAGRIARVLLIECDLEGERPDPGKKVELVGDRAAVKTQREHHQFATPESLPGDLHEVFTVGRIRGERAAALAFPGVRLKLKKLLDPGVGVVARSKRRVFEPAGLCKAPFLTPVFFPPSPVQRGADIDFGVGGGSK